MQDQTGFGLTRAPQHIVFGAGQRRAIARYAATYGKRLLVVTDTRQAADPDFAEVMESARATGLELAVFDGVAAELPLDCIEAGAEAGRALDADVILGIGGGSCLDAAKVIALLLRHGGRPQDYYGERNVPGPVLPLIAVPTTAGTGSEVTPVAVLADPERAVKIGIASPWLIPTVAICDPELTATCPPGLTAVSGADALTHAIEAFTTLRRAPDTGLSLEHVFVGKNALSDHYALEAIRLISGSLARAVNDGADPKARAAMAQGAMLAGLAFGTAGTAAAHAIQYPVGAMTHTPHGAGVATLMPYVMAWNRPACAPALAQVGAAMGLASGGNTEDDARAAIIAVADLFADIGIPNDLKALGVPDDRLADVAKAALGAERLVKNNPRTLDLQGMTDIVTAAHSGDLAGLLADTETSDTKVALQ